MRVIATEHPVPVPPTAEHPEGSLIQPAPAEPVEVPENAYFLRRIASGELARVDESVEALPASADEAQAVPDTATKVARGAKATTKGVE